MTLTVDTTALDELNTARAKELHVLMGKLHSCGINSIVDLPQIVVIGEQSAGKSSVLEAISGVRFPVAPALCTRFATEISLYKTDHSRVNVRIRYHDDARGDPAFDESGADKEDLPGMIEKAKEFMGIERTSKDFSKDVLCVSMEGPEMVPLTLVDLPGLFRVETEDQTSAGIETVNYLADRYMAQGKSIMLVVVEANIDIPKHEALAKVKSHDPKHERSLGVITKPDLASDHQKTTHIRLAKNLESKHTFKLGWHVLRNRAEETESPDSRDAIERTFFESSEWNTVDKGDLGIASLRQKLSSVLYNHTRTCLPGVIRDIEQNLARRQQGLDELGPERSEPKDMRSFLLRIAVEFQRLTRDANSGHYVDGFFGELTAPQNRLRAELRGFHRAFDYIVKTRGHTLHIEEGEEGDVQSQGHNAVPDFMADFLATNPYDFPLPERVSRKDMNARLERLATTTEGRELPGACNSELAVHLFKTQASPWRDMARFHLQRVTVAAKVFVGNLLAHIVGSKNAHPTADTIFGDYVDVFFKNREALLEQKLEQLLVPYMEGYAVPLDAEFREMVDRWTVERMAARLQNLPLAQLAKPQPFGAPPDEKVVLSAAAEMNQSIDGGTYATERIIDMMQAYYEMSRRTFTENIMNLAIEGCLIQDLPTIFTPLLVGEMDDDRLKQLASEPPSASARRVQLTKEIEALKEGLDKCRRWRPRSELAQQSTQDANIGTIAPSLWPATDSAAKMPDLSKLTLTGQSAVEKASSTPAKTSAQYTGGDFGKSVLGNPGSGDNKAPLTSNSSSLFGTASSTNSKAPPTSVAGPGLFSRRPPEGRDNKAPLTSNSSSLFGTASSTSSKAPPTSVAGPGLFSRRPPEGSDSNTPSTVTSSGWFGTAGSTDSKAPPTSVAVPSLFSRHPPEGGGSNTPSTVTSSGLFSTAGSGLGKAPSPFAASTGSFGATTSQAGGNIASTSAFGFGSARAPAGSGSGPFSDSTKKTDLQPPYFVEEKGSSTWDSFQHICFAPQFQDMSAEELRFKHYLEGQ